MIGGNGAARFELAAKSESQEYAGLYIQVGTKGYWTNFVGGDRDSVRPDGNSDALEILSAPTDIENSHIKVCTAHSHPGHDGGIHLDGPSKEDIGYHISFLELLQDNYEAFKNIAVGTELTLEVVDIVFEKHGVWYFKVDVSNFDYAFEQTQNKKEGSYPEGLNKFKEITMEYVVEEYEEFGKEMIDMVEEEYALEGVKAKFMTYDEFHKQEPCDVNFGIEN